MRRKMIAQILNHFSWIMDTQGILSVMGVRRGKLHI